MVSRGQIPGTHFPVPNNASPARSPAPKSSCPLFSACISWVGSLTWSSPTTCANSCMMMARTKAGPSGKARVSVSRAHRAALGR